jgi:hypothetical protein
MRDGSDVQIVPVDIEKGWELFKASNHLHRLVKGEE